MMIVAMIVTLLFSACAGEKTLSSGVLGDIPTMADAREKASFDDQVTYSSSSKFEAVIAFYEQEMKANGWPARTFRRNGGSASASFTKDGHTVEIIIVDDPTVPKTIVVITEEKE